MWSTGTTRTWSHKSYRPLTVLTFRLDTWLWGTYRGACMLRAQLQCTTASNNDGCLAGMHVTNLVIYAVSCGLATMVVLDAFSRRRRLAAVAASLLFAVHPVHAEVVSSLTGRAEPLSAVFTLSSILAWRRIRHSRGVMSGASWALASFSLIALGTLCKETSLVAPALLLWYVWRGGGGCGGVWRSLTLRMVSDEVCHHTSGHQQVAPGVARTSSQLWLGVEHLCSKLLVVANRRRTWCLVAFTCLLLWVRVFTIAGGYNLVHSEYVHAVALSALGTLIKSALPQVV